MHSSKIKGNGFERELVNAARRAGLNAKRAYASNGESLGRSADVDLVIDDYAVQAKRRKRIADYLIPTGGADIQVIRADRSPAYAVIRFDKLLSLIKGKENK